MAWLSSEGVELSIRSAIYSKALEIDSKRRQGEIAAVLKVLVEAIVKSRCAWR
jgi:hypothetical protein